MELDSGQYRVGQTDENQDSRAGSADVMAKGYTKQRSRRESGSSRIFGPGASTLLAPMIKTLLDETGQSLREIDVIALTAGPGLFTGLRVGVVTAKTLAYATQAHLVGVNTLEVIAAQTAVDRRISHPNGINSIRVVLNAQRQQLFCGYYESKSNWNVTELEANQILNRDQWLGQIRADDLVTGAGLKPIVENIHAAHREVKVAAEKVWSTSAASVGKLAWHQFQSGKRDDLWKLQPFYFRPSAAEEKRNSPKSD